MSDLISTPGYRWAIALNPAGRYIYAAWGDNGFLEYRTFPLTAYYERKIRKLIAARFGRPKPIAWSDIPRASAIEWVGPTGVEYRPYR